LLEALKYAPEMTDTLLYSLIELMNDPTKVTVVSCYSAILLLNFLITKKAIKFDRFVSEMKLLNRF